MENFHPETKSAYPPSINTGRLKVTTLPLAINTPLKRHDETRSKLPPAKWWSYRPQGKQLSINLWYVISNNNSAVHLIR